MRCMPPRFRNRQKAGRPSSRRQKKFAERRGRNAGCRPLKKRVFSNRYCCSAKQASPARNAAVQRSMSRSTRTPPRSNITFLISFISCCDFCFCAAGRLFLSGRSLLFCRPPAPVLLVGCFYLPAGRSFLTGRHAFISGVFRRFLLFTPPTVASAIPPAV